MRTSCRRSPESGAVRCCRLWLSILVVTNQAVVANRQDNAVEIVSLGNTLNPLQITESRPVIAYGVPGTANLTLTINGSGFTGGSQVQLDGTAIPITSVSANGRQIVASVPGAMLGGARRYFVEVSNGGSAVSNVTHLTVVQPITVGRVPVGVAVDTDRDLAVATNSADGNVSLISLAAPSPESPQSLGPVGTFGLPVTVGTMPEGVAVLPRLGVAVVANNGSNNATVVDVTGVHIPVNVNPVRAGCARNPDGCWRLTKTWEQGLRCSPTRTRARMEIRLSTGPVRLHYKSGPRTFSESS